jgi:hypothetical protein
MEYLTGFVLALAVAGLASGIGFARDRSFAPTLLIVIASYYVLFALIGASTRTLVVETFIAGGFSLLALVGFRTNLWLVAGALIGHGVFDFLHPLFVDNPGVPSWWSGFCLAFDVLFGGWFAVLLARRSHPSLSANSFRHQGSFDARS